MYYSFPFEYKYFVSHTKGKSYKKKRYKPILLIQLGNKWKEWKGDIDKDGWDKFCQETYYYSENPCESFLQDIELIERGFNAKSR